MNDGTDRPMTAGSGVPIDDLLAAGPDPAVPMRLRRLHRALEVGDTVHWSPESSAAWPPGLLDVVLTGGGFLHPTDKRSTRAWTLPDTVGPDMKLLVVGLNPSPMAADLGVGFARPGNRFWPAALAAGIAERDRDPEAALADHGLGMTDLVKRTTRQAKELSPAEFREGLERLTAMVAWLRPAVVCVVGLTGWRIAVDRRADSGVQPADLGSRPVYLMPNPSGLNAHVTVGDLAEHFRNALAIGAFGRPG